ncbi:unnamed protein product [Closterium sp. NIES-54]
MAEFTGTHFLFKKKPSNRPAYRQLTVGLAAYHQTLQSHHSLLRRLRRLLLRLLQRLRLPLLLLFLRVRWPLTSPTTTPCLRSCSHRRSTSIFGVDDDVQDAEEDWRAEGDTGAEGGTETDTEATTEAGTAEDVFPEDAPGGDDDDGVEYWSRNGIPEKLLIPTYPPRNQKRPHPSSQNHDSRPPSPRHKPNDHKRQAYTATEKLKWVAQLDVAVSVRALARESGIHRKYLANWKRAADFLKEVHSARKRMHGRGRATWYRPMEIKMYERLLDWRRKGTAVSVGCLHEWSRESVGYQKERVTVMLACTADGMKLKPWVFFKRKIVPKRVFPLDVVVACHDNGSMDANGVIRWLEECVKPFLKPGFGRHARSSMVVLDLYRCHLTEGVKEKFRELNCVPTIIPSGCTAEVQPLDVCINKSFKASILCDFVGAGNLKKPPPEVVVRWISRAWKAVPVDFIKRAFLTCGISNALDGSEDGLAMAHKRSQLTAEPCTCPMPCGGRNMTNGNAQKTCILESGKGGGAGNKFIVSFSSSACFSAAFSTRSTTASHWLADDPPADVAGADVADAE